uniref:Small ribosomal subunit protein mS23 n=1 Tax=Echinostoma caproni TaxID=27848 RepID=A0A183AU31_9TREM
LLFIRCSRSGFNLTSFSRLEGLIQNGVIPYEQRPVWYDVYKAFPPKEEPVFNRPIPDKVIRPILYPEDIVRACFMIVSNQKTTHPDLESDQLFSLAENDLQKEGTILYPNN